jgi:RHS repeat-associated protein
LVYDSEQRVSSRTIQGRSGATTYVRNYSYNDDDQPTQIGDEAFTYEYPSGRLSTTTLGKISDSRTYDAYGNLETYTAIYTPTTGSPTTLYTYTLTRDLMSKITSMSETVLGTTTTWDYTYDDAGRLTQVLKNSAAYSSYTYDDNGNRVSGKTAGTSFTATYDDQDRILTYNSRNYSYNANGDITQYGSGTTNNTYTFDALGKLKAATTTAGANLAYSLDGLGRRIRKTDGGSFKYQYIYETGERIAAHVNNSGVIQKEYIYGVEHSNVPDYMVSSGVNYRIIKDHLGSPRLVVSAGNGTVAQQIDYDDLGNVISDTNPGFQHFGFAGGNYDSQTKLTKFGAREYDARSAGRWMTKDPIRFDGGDSNLYGYCVQDPVNWTDPEGTTSTANTMQTGMTSGGGTPVVAGLLQAAAMAEALQCSMSAKKCQEDYIQGEFECLKKHANDPIGFNKCMEPVRTEYILCIKRYNSSK